MDAPGPSLANITEGLDYEIKTSSSLKNGKNGGEVRMKQRGWYSVSMESQRLNYERN